MSFSAIRDKLDERYTFARTRAIHGALRHFISRDDVIAVGSVAVHAITNRLVDQLLCGGLFRERSRVRVSVVLDDDDERALLHGREIDPFVKSTRGCRAVADV